MKKWWTNQSKQLSRGYFIPKSPPLNVNTKSWYTHKQIKEKIKRKNNIVFTKENYEIQPNTLKRKRISQNTTSKRIKPDVKLRTFKMRIYPNKRQKKLLRKWIGTCRFLYNQTINLINDNYKERVKNNETKYINDFDTINQLMGKGCKFTKEHEWLLNTPSHPKSNVIRDAFKARKSCFGLLKKKFIKKFKLHFRRKKYGGYITIPKNVIKKGGIIYKTKLCNKNYPEDKNYPKKDKYDHLKVPKRCKKARELLNQEIKYDCKILLDRNRNYWLLIPYEVKIKNQNQDDRMEYVSLDPGVRTFQAYYSPDGVCGELGKNDLTRIYRLTKHLDKMQSKMTKVKSKKRYRIKRAWLRLINKIKTLVNEVHKRISIFLTSNFKNILLPKFETSKMVKKNHRNIKSKTARAMLTWSHYRFQTYLRSICERTNTNLIIVTEEYTSKTCGKCGTLKENLGSNKVFECSICGLKIDRDINGARNILLKYRSEALC